MSRLRLETWMVYIILLSILALPAYAEEVLLSTQQTLSLGNNTTLVIEDVNPPQGVVWLKIYDRNKTIGSTLMSLGEYISYNDINLTLYRIYSGGDNDLVAFLIGNKTAAHAPSTSVNLSANDTKKSSGYGAISTWPLKRILSKPADSISDNSSGKINSSNRLSA